MLHGLVGFFVDIVCCRFKLGVYKPKEASSIVKLNVVQPESSTKTPGLVFHNIIFTPVHCWG